jgi:hypothetical protein
MTNTASLRKVSVAKSAGLLALAALAVAFFAFPMVALGKDDQTPQLLNGFKADLVGLVAAPPPAGKFTIQALKPGTTSFALSIAKVFPLKSLTKAKWLAVNVRDTTNQTYGFMASVNKVDQTTRVTTVLIGTPAQTALTSPLTIQKFQGKLLPLNFRIVGANIVGIPGPTGSGWGATTSAVV